MTFVGERILACRLQQHEQLAVTGELYTYNKSHKRQQETARDTVHDQMVKSGEYDKSCLFVCCLKLQQGRRRRILPARSFRLHCSGWLAVCNLNRTRRGTVQAGIPTWNI